MKLIATLTYIISANVGLAKVIIFMFHKWGILGALSVFFAVPLFVAPIWEWVDSGSPWTFIFIYVLFPASMFWRRVLINMESDSIAEQIRRRDN